MFNPKPRNDPFFGFPKQCIWLKLNGTWPLKASFTDTREMLFAYFYRVWSWYVIVSVGITIYFQSAFLVHTFGDIIMTTENCCTTFMGALNFVRLIHLKLEQKKFKQVIDQFVKEIWIQKNSYPHIEKVCKQKMKIYRNMTILLASLISMYCIMPLVELLTSVEPDATEKPFPYKMLFPFDAHHGYRYVFTYCFTAYAGICVVTTLFAEDSIFGFFITYTCGQFHILHDRIDALISESHYSVLRRNGSVSIKVVQEEYRNNLKKVAYRQNQLMEYSRLLEDFFNPILLVNFVISSILICMVGFQLVTVVALYFFRSLLMDIPLWFGMVNRKGKDMFIGDYVKFIVYISSSLSQLFILCWNGDSLIQYSTETAKHLYLNDWEGSQGTPTLVRSSAEAAEVPSTQAIVNTLETTDCFYPTNKEFRNDLRFMILCSQKPIRITAFKFSTLSLQSFTAILSTSMSYFTLLQTVYDEGQDK